MPHNQINIKAAFVNKLRLFFMPICEIRFSTEVNLVFGFCFKTLQVVNDA